MSPNSRHMPTVADPADLLRFDAAVVPAAFSIVRCGSFGATDLRCNRDPEEDEMPIGECHVTEIKVLKDGDAMGSADMHFALTVNGSGQSLGRFPATDSGDTLKIGMTFLFPLTPIISLRFTATDEEPHVWGMSDQVADHVFEIDTRNDPLPCNGHMTANQNGVKARVYFNLSFGNVMQDVIGLRSSLKCRGSVEGPRWLDGNTVTGTVALAPKATSPYTGAAWIIHDLGDDRIAFECLGNVPGPKWLDGNTVDGTVGLAPELGGRFTGTAWRANAISQDQFTLECLGDVPGSKWLDGNTVAGTVSLAPHTGTPYSGTVWSRF
ncbi:hypothetical protein [Mesorhizobium sp.]|uniref:hypothetical protein n=1 Tax=Mesorhizobium sp. TaxID=1871066 RepID=UPI003562C883